MISNYCHVGIMSTVSTAQGKSPSLSSKPPRVLACVLCQQRKVKCDRKYPCANCIKARTPCVPATHVSRPRRRRFPERELLDRVRKYEDLLRQNDIKFEPLHGFPSGTEPRNIDDGYDSDNEHPKTLAVGSASPSTTISSDRAYYFRCLLLSDNLSYID
jgi:hypothetical protein